MFTFLLLYFAFMLYLYFVFCFILFIYGKVPFFDRLYLYLIYHNASTKKSKNSLNPFYFELSWISLYFSFQIKIKAF